MNPRKQIIFLTKEKEGGFSVSDRTTIHNEIQMSNKKTLRQSRAYMVHCYAFILSNKIIQNLLGKNS